MIQVFFKLKYNSYRIFHYKFYHKLRIGCASGFWGDTSVSVPQLIYKGKLNFLVFDYLSEITMSLLAKAKVNDPTKGFTPDFISIAQYASELKKQGIRVIANAGGINPDACYNELKKCLEKSGVNMKIAIIKGDDCMDKNDLLNQMENFDDEKLPKSNLLSSNIYLGASPIKFALDKGADIVITGRCVDSALVLGPLMHHFKWDNNDLDKLAAGSLAGHLIECGAQVTGGIFTDCFSVPDWWNIGFPIVEVEQNGEFIVTKPENTGGIVTSATVKEQLVYEIGNPSEYVLPDVICDFTFVTVTDIGNDQVKVSGAKGINPPITFKVSSTSLENYRLTAVAVVVGKDAVKKARLTAENILKRVRGILKVLKISDFSRWNISVVGGEDSYGNAKNLSVTEEVREAVIWLAVEHSELKPLKILSSEIAPAGTGMAPGLTGLIGGRPKISPILKLYSSLINKDKVNLIKMKLPKIPKITPAATAMPISHPYSPLEVKYRELLQKYDKLKGTWSSPEKTHELCKKIACISQARDDLIIENRSQWIIIADQSAVLQQIFTEKELQVPLAGREPAQRINIIPASNQYYTGDFERSIRSFK